MRYGSAVLSGLGCDALQGYHIGKPMSAADLAVHTEFLTGPGRRFENQ